MPLSLLKLIRLQTRGHLRRLLRGVSSPRKAVFLIIGVAVIALWLMPPLLTSWAVRHRPEYNARGASTRFNDMAPIALLGICLMTMISSAGDRAVAFTAGEVDVLFPGPFTRRQLLAYKLLKSALVALLTAAMFSVLLMPYAWSWSASYVGVFLTLLFVQWFCTAGVLLGQALGQRLNTLMRAAIGVGAAVLVIVMVRHWTASLNGTDALYHFRDSQLGGAVLQPFEPFIETITASPRRPIFRPATRAALTDLGLLAIVVLLDANYLEAAMSASQRRYAQLQRIRSGSLLSSRIKGDIKWRLPRPRWAGGAGPIIWRQATNAARSAKGLLLVMLLIAIGAGPALGSVAQSVDISSSLVPALVWATVLLSGLMKFDFRGDLDHFDVLKALPIPTAALSIGQIAVPTLILSIFHVIMLLGVAAMTRAHREVLIVAAALALPFNALLMASDNLIFLLFPSRPAAASPGDFQMLGRQAAQIVMKGLAVVIGAVIAFAIATPIFILTGGSLLVLTLLAGAVLIAETCALVPAIGSAFRRFDPSIDMPP